jgi:uncharacterized small protein (DUF1192 family)
MSLIKNFFIKQEDEPEQKAVETTQQRTPISVATFGGTSGVNTMATAPVLSGDVNTSSEDYTQHFQKLIGQGSAYSIFLEGLKGVEALPITEEQKFVTVATMKGLSQETLVKDLSAFMVAIDQNKQEFEEALEGSMKLNVTSKEEEVATLQQQITEATQRIAVLQTEITQNKIRLSGKNMGYNAAYENAKTKVNDQINKVKLYVKSTN